MPELVFLEPGLSKRLKVTARRLGVSLETLVNVWLEQKALADSS